MNGKTKYIICIASLVVLVAILPLLAEPANTEVADKKIRVGVFDSRALAIAHFFDFVHKGGLEELKEKHEEAKKKGDSEKAKELETQGSDLQEQLHKQVFGTADIDNVLNDIKNDITRIAKTENLNIVINKWDIVYQNSTAEYIDITNELVGLFDPDEKTLKDIEELMKYPPVSKKELEKMDHSKD